MEDRITPFLYLELADAKPEEYAAGRVEQVLVRPGVDRASWWRNLNPHRTDFEPDFTFRIPDFATLGVYETQSEFVAPPAEETIRGLSFRHYPGPVKGS
ncbi:MAG: hypothetical protein CL908_21480 [Deltaproteobacteria bacterium]|nr:hypothetical protein [Deltaproteobacteria bacterium]